MNKYLEGPGRAMAEFDWAGQGCPPESFINDNWKWHADFYKQGLLADPVRQDVIDFLKQAIEFRQSYNPSMTANRRMMSLLKRLIAQTEEAEG